jgi:hypothetical protein
MLRTTASTTQSSAVCSAAAVQQQDGIKDHTAAVNTKSFRASGEPVDVSM